MISDTSYPWMCLYWKEEPPAQSEEFFCSSLERRVALLFCTPLRFWTCSILFEWNLDIHFRQESFLSILGRLERKLFARSTVAATTGD
jgi:hypothetical protein